MVTNSFENGKICLQIMSRFPLTYFSLRLCNVYSHTGKKRQVNTPMPPGFGVAFFALLNNHSLNTNANQNIVFDKTITNIGGAFHTSSSLFVATIPGVYVFRYKLNGHFKRSGQAICTLYAHKYAVKMVIFSWRIKALILNLEFMKHLYTA